MLNVDPKGMLNRSVAAFIGVCAIGSGLHAIVVNNDFNYTNWFGGLVFAPVAILLGGVVLFGALFKPEILGRRMSRKKR
jgi:hypothetical protein